MTIGHNTPPAFEAISLHIEELFALASDTLAGLTAIDSDEQEAALDGLLADFRKAKKVADAARAEEKRPHDDAAKAVQARWKPQLERCDTGMREITGLLTPYREAKQRAKDEAARKAREEAEAKQRAAQEALRQADDMEARLVADQELAQAKRLAEAANRADRAPTGLRTYWEAELTDLGAAMRHYVANKPERFQALLQQLADEDARNEATRRNVPGVRFIERKRAH